MLLCSVPLRAQAPAADGVRAWYQTKVEINHPAPGPAELGTGHITAWPVDEVTAAGMKASWVLKDQGQPDLTGGFVVTYTAPPAGQVQGGTKVPLRIHAQLTGTHLGKVSLWVSGGGLDITNYGEILLDRDRPSADWSTELGFPERKFDSDGAYRIDCKWGVYWGASIVWRYSSKPDGFAVKASPTFSGPATSTLVSLSSAQDLTGATVDFGPGIKQLGEPTLLTDPRTHTQRLDCLITIAPDTALGPRTVAVALPDGKRGRAPFAVHPLVIILDIDGMRPDILLDCIRGGLAKNLALLLGEQTSLGDAGGAVLRRREFEHGVYLLDTATVFPSYTFATQASIFTGVEPGVHGVTGNMVFDRLGDMSGKAEVYGFDRTATDAVGVYYVNALADRAVRAETIYEAMAGKPGVGRSAVFSNQYANGVAAADRWVPTPDLMAAYIPAATTALYDQGMSTAAQTWLEALRGQASDQWPSILTLYFAGVDHTGHVVDDTEANKQRDYLTRVVDPEIGRVLEFVMDNCPGAVFILTADHGQTDIQKGKFITRRVLNKALGLESWTPYDWTPITTLSMSDVVITQNGGLAHVHVRARRQANLDTPPPALTVIPPRSSELLGWADAPDFRTVLQVAASFGRMNKDGVPELGPGPYFDLILVRDASGGWEAPYRVYRDDGSLETIGDYLRRTGNDFGERLGWKRNETDVAFLAERLQLHTCDRSGDVVLVPRYPEFYAEDGPVFGEHGSLKTTDMTIPFMVAQWQAHDIQPILDVLQRTVENGQRPRVTDVASTVAGFLGQTFRGRKHLLVASPGGGGQRSSVGATLDQPLGEVQVQSPGADWKSATPGQSLELGAALRTGADGQAWLHGSAPAGATERQVMRIGAGTEVTVAQSAEADDEQPGLLDLRVGEVEVKACRLVPGITQFAVRTPLLTVIGKGGAFAVRHTAQPIAETVVVTKDAILVVPAWSAKRYVNLDSGATARARAGAGGMVWLTIDSKAPTTPGGGAPVTPGGGAPVTPGGGAPVTPGGGAPVTPGGGAPVTPGGGAPTTPGGGTVPTAPGGTAPDDLGRPGRVLGYRQITAFEDRMALGNGIQPMLSRNGVSVAMAFAPDRADKEGKGRVATIRPDGSGFRWLDTYRPLLYVDLTVDINAHGTAIASTDWRQVRVVGVGGGAARQVLRVDGGLASIRLSPEGGTLYFAISARTRLTDTPTTLEKGLYATTDAGPPRLIVDEKAIATALGIAVTDLGSITSGSNGRGLDVSDDGQWLIFIASERGLKSRRHALVVGTNGQDLRRVFTLEGGGGVCSVGMSGDGSCVALSAQRAGKEGYEGWIMDANGGHQRLMTRSAAPMGSVCMSERGAAVFGQEGIVWSAEGAEPLPLATPVSLRNARLSTALMQDLTVDRRGRLGIYVVYDAKDRPQLARVQVDPRDLGDGPSITDIVCPSTLTARDRDQVRVSARVVGPIAPVGRVVVPVAYRDARRVLDVGRSAAMADNGKDGDAAAGDGTYTSDLLHAETASPLGPVMLRFYAEIEGADSRHHATAVEAARPNVVAPR
ncbi:MAG: alkaline phosphatase family protein [Armatimonadetes bacterium]|nr:alkaline phosphatase family protein [Armatimonadota bacterium]